jgi:hypothetical protein
LLLLLLFLQGRGLPQHQHPCCTYQLQLQHLRCCLPLLVTKRRTKLLLVLLVACLMIPDSQQQFDQLHVPAKVRQTSGQLATHMTAAAAAGLASYALLLPPDCQQTSAAPRQGRVPAVGL